MRMAVHRMNVLQGDLLKDLDQRQGLSPEVVAELHRTTDWATKQTDTAIGHSMAAMVDTERNL